MRGVSNFFFSLALLLPVDKKRKSAAFKTPFDKKPEGDAVHQM
jgi:hypothetical protein